MAPPGRPNMTSTPSISRLLMRAWAPVSCMVLLGGVVRDWGGKRRRPPGGRSEGARGGWGRRALGQEYEAGVDDGAGHVVQFRRLSAARQPAPCYRLRTAWTSST